MLLAGERRHAARTALQRRVAAREPPLLGRLPHPAEATVQLRQKPQHRAVPSLPQNRHLVSAVHILRRQLFITCTCHCFNQFYNFSCILATDMAKHQEILDSFESIIETFDISQLDHKNIVS